ncbi:MAG: 5-formyltetrahydrofolate cyclo-ligase [Clostridia bacterium]
MTKSETRAKLKLLRAKIENREEKEREIEKNFFSLSLNYKKVLVYIATNTEVSTNNIIKKLLSENIKVYAPKCIENGEMSFFRFNSLKDLEKGKFGILEPKETECLDSTENSICLVPALGFTLCGDRIGYGKGYYDKFLKKSSAISVGLCYNEQVCESIPTEKTDVKINFIISNSVIQEVK